MSQTHFGSRTMFLNIWNKGYYHMCVRGNTTCCVRSQS